MAYNLRKPPDWVICDHILAEFCLHLRRTMQAPAERLTALQLVMIFRMKLERAMGTRLFMMERKERQDGRKRSRRYLVLSTVVDAFYAKGLSIRESDAKIVEHSNWSKYIDEQVSEFCTDERADSINHELCLLAVNKMTAKVIDIYTAIICLREARAGLPESGVDDLFHPDSLSTWMSGVPAMPTDSGSPQSTLANMTLEAPTVGLSGMAAELVCMIARHMTPDAFLAFRAINHRTRDTLEEKFLYDYFRTRRVSLSMKSVFTLWEISLDLRLSAQLQIRVHCIQLSYDINSDTGLLRRCRQ